VLNFFKIERLLRSLAFNLGVIILVSSLLMLISMYFSKDANSLLDYGLVFIAHDLYFLCIGLYIALSLFFDRRDVFAIYKESSDMITFFLFSLCFIIKFIPNGSYNLVIENQKQLSPGGFVLTQKMREQYNIKD
jgi:hypothetical protein